MTPHNNVHYRIARLCVEKTPQESFPAEAGGETTYAEYFALRYGKELDPHQPLLHCPIRGRPEIYLPAQLAFLTGLDDDWHSDQAFSKSLWARLRVDPEAHWERQRKLVEGLSKSTP